MSRNYSPDFEPIVFLPSPSFKLPGVEQHMLVRYSIYPETFYCLKAEVVYFTPWASVLWDREGVGILVENVIWNDGIIVMFHGEYCKFITSTSLIHDWERYFPWSANVAGLSKDNMWKR